MRADQLLVERGLAASRSQAQRLIAGGMRWHDGRGWHAVGKNGDELPADAPVELDDAAEARYVSRGGLKLEGALRAAGLAVTGWRCLDVGQSTGGFTDCLLQHGAAQVVGVDVGHGQLHPRVRGDARVVAIEQCNARALDAAALGVAADFDLAVADLSFISLTLVLPAFAPLVRAGGRLLLLAKPQFELQPGQLGKGGVVRDAALYPVVEQRLRAACAAGGLHVDGWFDSPIRGGDGNREFFLLATRTSR
ncbi:MULTISPECIES: TlyA family RNA methyltransferase [Ramlibacter]|uniref:TlyA family RNA methyltransferase n=1 Tax=Ramlibacter pinisoli TaxID=2682844 RepID=A0A6N8J2Y9_9BURK|nr:MULTISPECIES: TlyA family RNA methyltransferase [Ramlibacter]MBA2962681.1 TlyA family RNA methyltransferase [Ramlibacter sp. CGMCC 1.13660]MVQ32623.1 TlyA family RNA methyltransferase [Ramlibacter pinisoli]